MSDARHGAAGASAVVAMAIRRRAYGQGLHHDRGVLARCVVCGASPAEATLERQTLEEHPWLIGAFSLKLQGPP